MVSMIALTHDGLFHNDDVFGGVILKLVYGDELEFIRTRDLTKK